METSSWKIADFGLTSEATSNHLVTTHYGRGKPCYRAPELLSEQSGYNNKVDIWALGCILCELITRKKTFSGDYPVLQYALASKDELSRLLDVQTEEVRMIMEALFIANLLYLDPRKRPSAKHLQRLYEIPIFLVESGVSTFKHFTWTALDALLTGDRMDLLEVMLEAGIRDVHEVEDGRLGQRLLKRATIKRHKKVVVALLKAGFSDASILFHAASTGDTETVEFMLDAGSLISISNSEGETLLHCAALHGHVDTLFLLLSTGANAALRASSSGLTALHYAAVGGHLEAVNTLMSVLSQAGADLYHKSNNGVSPVHIAALNGTLNALESVFYGTGQQRNGPDEDFYDSGWIKRYQRAWDGERWPLSKTDLYELPLPLKIVGDGWFALFNPGAPREFNISLLLTIQFRTPVYSVCFSKDGDYVAAAGGVRVEIFETQSGKSVGSLVDDSQDAKPPGQPFKCVCFDPNSENMDILAGKFTAIDLWDISSQRVKRSFLGHETEICSLETSCDGSLLASAAADGTVRMWNMRSGQPLLTLRTEEHHFRSVAISPNGRLIATASTMPDGEDEQTRISRFMSSFVLWNSDGIPLETFGQRSVFHKAASLAFSPTGDELITGNSCEVNEWHLSTTSSSPGKWSRAFGGFHKSKPASPKFISHKSKSHEYGPPPNFHPLYDTPLHDKPLYDMAYGATGNVFATASESGRVTLWSGHLQRPNPVARLHAHEKSGRTRNYERV